MLSHLCAGFPERGPVLISPHPSATCSLAANNPLHHYSNSLILPLLFLLTLPLFTVPSFLSPALTNPTLSSWPVWLCPSLSGTHLSRASVPMASACAEILSHMDMTMVLSALVRDMAVAELELGVSRTDLCGTQPPGSTYIHGIRVGARLWGWGLLSDPVTMGSQSLVGQVGEGLSPLPPWLSLRGGVGHSLARVQQR